MNRERESILILHTHPHVPARACVCACVYGAPEKTLRNSNEGAGDSHVVPSCWWCRFFEPETGVDLAQPFTDDTLPGECRFYPPTAGDRLRPDSDSDERWYGYFPKVMAGDWCGHFRSRAVNQ